MHAHRSFRLFIGTILVALFLTGCSGDESSESLQIPDSGVANADNSSSETDGLTSEQLDYVFVTTVRDIAPHYALSPDEDVISLGHTVCLAFDNGMTFLKIIATMNTSEPVEDAAVVGAAVTAYCPEYKSQLSQ